MGFLSCCRGVITTIHGQCLRWLWTERLSLQKSIPEIYLDSCFEMILNASPSCRTDPLSFSSFFFLGGGGGGITPPLDVNTSIHLHAVSCHKSNTVPFVPTLAFNLTTPPGSLIPAALPNSLIWACVLAHDQILILWAQGRENVPFNFRNVPESPPFISTVTWNTVV